LAAQQLEQIEQLIAQAKFSDALKELTTLENSDQLTTDDRLIVRYLQSTVILKMGRFKEGTQIAEQLLKDSKKVGNPLLELNSLINTLWGLQCLGRWDEGLQLASRGENLLKILTQTQQLGLKEKQATILHHKGSILYSKGEINKGLDLLKTSLALREEIGDKNGIIDSLYVFTLEKWGPERVLEYSQKILALNEAIGDQQGIGKANLAIGQYFKDRGELDRAEKYLQKSLTIFEAIEDQFSLAMSLFQIGYIYLHKGKFNQAFEKFQSSLALFEVTGHQKSIAWAHNFIGAVYGFKGEMDLSSKHNQKSMSIFEAIGDQRGFASTLNNRGCYYGERGDFKSATDYFKRSLKISRKFGYHLITMDSLYQQIRHYVDILPSKTVKSYLAEMRKINNLLGAIPRINQRYRLAEAIVLNTYGRLVDKTRAQTIFQQIASEDIVWLELTVDAIINLSGLLLFEIKTLGNDLALNDLKQVIQRLSTKAENENSYWLLINSFLLRSKLTLLDLDIVQAEHLLTQGEHLAIEKGLLKLARMISVEREILCTHSDKWKRIIDQKPSTSEMIELTQFNTIIERMIRKRIYQTEEEIIEYTKKVQQLIEVWDQRSWD